jgi:hypothetical protein
MLEVKLAFAMLGVGMLAAADIVAPGLPIDPFLQLGLGGTLAFILWWTVAKTIPALSKDHKESILVQTTAIQQQTTRLESAIKEQASENNANAARTHDLLARLVTENRPPK